MPRMSEFDRDALARLLRRQHDVLTREQALACGMSQDVIRYRCRDGGPWQVVLPGVYVTHTGPPTGDQRDMAALLYAGPRSVLAGAAALRRHGLKAPSTAGVDVLVPLTTRRRDAAFVRFHRTNRLPARICVAGEIRFVLPPRAVADAVRDVASMADVRAIVADAVQRGKCPLPRLSEELASGPVRGSAGLRQALAEVADGIRSSAEGDLRDLIMAARLPMPMFNPRLYVGQTLLAIPDCWWPQEAVAAEADSRAWHLSPSDWEDTLARHARMSAQGILVLHFTPAQIRYKQGDVAAAIRRALAAGRNRRLPHITTLPAIPH
jgi:hypothetical protein